MSLARTSGANWRKSSHPCSETLHGKPSPMAPGTLGPDGQVMVQGGVQRSPRRQWGMRA